MNRGSQYSNVIYLAASVALPGYAGAAQSVSEASPDLSPAKDPAEPHAQAELPDGVIKFSRAKAAR